MMNKKKSQFLAACALSAALLAGQINVASASENGTAIQMGSIIPDNVTIDEPVALSQISLPGSEYGTLSWVNSSSVPSQRVQSYDVVFTPYDSTYLADISGWDGQSGVIYSSVTVVVNSIDNEPSNDSAENYYEDYDRDSCSEEYTGETEDNASSRNSSSDENQDKTKSENASDTENISTAERKEEQSDKADETGADVNNTDEMITQMPVVTGTDSITEAPAVSKAAEITEIPGSDDDKEITAALTAVEKSDNAKEELTPAADPTEAASDSDDLPNTDSDKDSTDASGAAENTDSDKNNSSEDSTDEKNTDSDQPSQTTEVTDPAEDNNIFDGDQSEIKKDDRTSLYGEDLSDEEKAAAAEENHTCNGISVSGNGLPWYVQFRVSSGDEYQFSNEENAKVFKSYEFELWDLKNDTEYEIPDGEYISVTVPVKSGYEYTIEHLLDNGALETIVPSVEGSTMVFSTHSFSPFSIAGFSIAGSSSVVNDIGTSAYESGSSSAGTTASATATSTPAVTKAAAATSAAASSESSSSTDVSANNTTDTSSDNESTDAAQSTPDSNSANSVNTGDTTPILPFVILGVAAVAIIAVIVYLRKRK